MSGEAILSSTLQEYAATVKDQLLDVVEIKRRAQAALDHAASSSCDYTALVASFKDLGERIEFLRQQWPEVQTIRAAIGAAAAVADTQARDSRRQLTASQAQQAARLLEQAYCCVPHPSCTQPIAERKQRLAAAAAPDLLVGVVQRVQQLLAPQKFRLTLFGPYGVRPDTATEVHVLCPGVFGAAVALSAPGVPEPVHVSMIAAPHPGQQLSAWVTPRQQVFKRVSALAAAALAYYLQQAGAGAAALNPAAPVAAQQAPTAAEAAGAGSQPGGSSTAAAGEAGGAAAAAWALECLLLWLAQYQDLFSRPCAVSGKLLCWEPASSVPLVPVVRPFRLSLQQLRAAASDPSRRQAYHAHLAPKHLLQLDRPGTAGPPAPGQQLFGLSGGSGAAAGDTDDLGDALGDGCTWEEDQLEECMVAAGLLPSRAGPQQGDMTAAAAGQVGQGHESAPEEAPLWEVVYRTPVPPPPAPLPAAPAPAQGAGRAEAAAGGSLQHPATAAAAAGVAPGALPVVAVAGAGAASGGLPAGSAGALVGQQLLSEAGGTPPAAGNSPEVVIIEQPNMLGDGGHGQLWMPPGPGAVDAGTAGGGMVLMGGAQQQQQQQLAGMHGGGVSPFSQLHIQQQQQPQQQQQQQLTLIDLTGNDHTAALSSSPAGMYLAASMAYPAAVSPQQMMDAGMQQLQMQTQPQQQQMYQQPYPHQQQGMVPGAGASALPAGTPPAGAFYPMPPGLHQQHQQMPPQ